MQGVIVASGYSEYGTPNATLCGRYVAGMVLKKLETVLSSTFSKVGGEVITMILLRRDVGVPEQYLITQERTDRATGRLDKGRTTTLYCW
jgi:hypothetical protein